MYGTNMARDLMAQDLIARDLYDRRDEIGGLALHDLFDAVCDDPSPAGATPISVARLRAYAAELRRAPQDPAGSLETIAVFAESFLR